MAFLSCRTKLEYLSENGPCQAEYYYPVEVEAILSIDEAKKNMIEILRHHTGDYKTPDDTFCTFKGA